MWTRDNILAHSTHSTALMRALTCSHACIIRSTRGDVFKPSVLETVAVFDATTTVTNTTPALTTRPLISAKHHSPALQGVCNSCWAFASVSLMQALLWQATGVQHSLAVQDLMDCCSLAGCWAGNTGCSRGGQCGAWSVGDSAGLTMYSASWGMCVCTVHSKRCSVSP